MPSPRRTADVQAAALAKVEADEQRLHSPAARRPTLTVAAGEFWRHPSPWILAAMVLVTLTARVLAGDVATSDAVLLVVMVVTFPFVEWVIHVVILHWRPRTLGALTVDPLLAREHRRHHADPRDIPLVFIPWPVYLWLVPALAAIGLLAFPRIGLGLTYLLVLSLFGMAYEWTHYLIHSDYRPRSRAYRAIWRNHRLHHYKNERYWFSVTTSGTSDRVLGTYPDPATVETSGTAKDLLASARRGA